MPTSNEQPYSWLDVGSEITGVLSQFPHRIKEAAEMDRRIRANELSNQDMYGAVNEMALRVAEDKQLAPQVAANLGLDANSYTSEDLHRRIIESFPEASEQEDAGQYANKMSSTFASFLDNAGRGLNSNLFSSLMMDPGTGLASENSLQTLSNIENREGIASYQTQAGAAQTSAEIEAAGRATGFDYANDERYTTMVNQENVEAAATLLADPAVVTDINNGDHDIFNLLRQQGTSDAVIQEMYKQINAAAEYNKLVGDIANASGRVENERARVALAQSQFAETRRINQATAAREAAEGNQPSVNLVEDDIADLLVDANKRVTQYADAEDEEGVAQLEEAENQVKIYEQLLGLAKNNNGIYESVSDAINATLQPSFILNDMTLERRRGGMSDQKDIIERITSEGYTINNPEEAQAQGAPVEFVDVATGNVYTWSYGTGSIVPKSSSLVSSPSGSYAGDHGVTTPAATGSFTGPSPSAGVTTNSPDVQRALDLL